MLLSKVLASVSLTTLPHVGQIDTLTMLYMCLLPTNRIGIDNR